MPCRAVEYSQGDVVRNPKAAADDPVEAFWADGTSSLIYGLSCAEYDSIQATDNEVKNQRRAPAWETRPSESSRIWVTRPSKNHNHFCIFLKQDGVQSQMLQVKGTAFGDDEESVDNLVRHKHRHVFVFTDPRTRFCHCV